MSSDEHYMKQCLELALHGLGSVSPNPMVGAILVYQDKIIGQGYHQRYGESHAEVNCIQSVSEADKGLIAFSTLYVSLEPCSHFGKTPPCVDLILAHQIQQVVIGCKDTSGHVNGQGIQKLKDHGVKVIENVLSEEAKLLNKRFFTFHHKKRPYIVLKWAQSKEGFIGDESTQVKLSNPSTDVLVHQWRAEEDAIWVGFNTVRTDNPQLNVRLISGRNPIRIVYDRDLQLEQFHNIFDQSQKTIIFNNKLSGEEKNIQWVCIEDKNHLSQILSFLYTQNMLSVLVEGGSKILEQFINLHLWDEARVIKTDYSLNEGIKAPHLNNPKAYHEVIIGNDRILFYQNNTSH